MPTPSQITPALPSSASPRGASPRALAFDALIVGSGLAGLSTALYLPQSWRVAVITKRHADDTATAWAQGGIAGVMGEGDSLEQHVSDTFVAGAGLCDEAATRFIVEHAPQAVRWLQELGVPFTQEGAELHLTREGGHSQRRIAHATDATGAAVETTLLERVRAQPNITLFEQHTLVDLITTRRLGLSPATAQRCLGLYAHDEESDEVLTFTAPYTVLATGGAGKVYLFTTNPHVATGDGIAVAWRAGCRVANMEFIQFHPTALYHPHAKSFLITEAVRGEGGILRLPKHLGGSAGGERFMQRYDARLELAPRDIVARAIDAEIKKHGIDCVHLDISHQGEAFVREHFPTIYERCLSLGIDITKEPIPVVPAAHYTCGGVMTDLDARTDLDGLYAVGEVTYTGLHGANRLASNSLVECAVLGKAAAAHMQQRSQTEPTDAQRLAQSVPAWDDSRVTDADEAVVIHHNWEEIRRLMWNYVGIVRTDKRLQRAARRIQALQEEVDDFYAHFHVGRDLLELRNLVTVADLIIQSALKRRESRGLHYNRDVPDLDDEQAKPTILLP